MTGGVSGKGTEAQKHAEVLAADAGARLDNALKEAKQGVSKIDNKLESYRQEAEKTIEQKAHEAQVTGKNAVDAFDKNVTEVSLLCARVMLVWTIMLTMSSRPRPRQRAAHQAGSAARSRGGMMMLR